MLLTAPHQETRTEVLQEFIRQNPLGIITTAIDSPNYPLLQATHLPLVLDTPEADGNGGDLGKLRGHLAKMNPHSKAMMEQLEAKKAAGAPEPLKLEKEVLIVFNGPHHHYVTPKFYTETKPDSGRVVPTWNYSAVQVYGTATVHYSSASPETGAFLQQQMHDLSQNAEVNIMGYDGVEKAAPWKVTDAPEKYIELLKKNIIGIEIRITRLEGKYKMSQEMRVGDREGVVRGFERMGTEIGTAMANTVRERGELKDAEKK